MGSIIQLFVSLFALSLWLLMQIIQLTVGLLSMALSLGSKAASRGPATRSVRYSPPRPGGRPSGTGRFVLFVLILLVVFAASPSAGLALVAIAAVVWLVRRRSSKPRTATAQELSELFANVRAMSGQQFESFTAHLFRAMGFPATVLGGSGDQGVDVVLEAKDGRIAVQCKNYAKAVGNKPVQEVDAGARHHGCNQAWVVAPAGFTKGAFELASSVGVSLFDAGSIRTWIAQVDSIAREREANGQAPDGGAARVETDRADYDQLLDNYRQYIHLLEELHVQKAQHKSEYRADPSLGEKWSETYEGIRASIDGTLAKMDVLEARSPGLATEERTEERAALASRQMRIGESVETGFDVEGQVRKLAELRDVDVLTEEEFEAKRGLLAARAQAERGHGYCTSCGSELPAEANFCAACGTARP